MKMSEICRKAANEHLWDGVDLTPSDDVCEHSCVALKVADPDDEYVSGETPLVSRYLEAAGIEFLGAYFGSNAQAERFMLLHFAALYFEDLGE